MTTDESGITDEVVVEVTREVEADEDSTDG